MNGRDINGISSVSEAGFVQLRRRLGRLPAVLLSSHPQGGIVCITARTCCRVGIIGAGGNTKARHIPNLRQIPGVRLHAVCNRTLASSRAASEQLGIPHATDSWRAVIDDPEVDAVVIGTWPYMHATLAIAALEAGKHVLTEARMVSARAGKHAVLVPCSYTKAPCMLPPEPQAMNAAEAHAMLAAQRRHPHLVAQIVPSPFTLPWDATVQDILRSGK